jgi:hypothetical protein
MYIKYSEEKRDFPRQHHQQHNTQTYRKLHMSKERIYYVFSLSFFFTSSYRITHPSEPYSYVQSSEHFLEMMREEKLKSLSTFVARQQCPLLLPFLQGKK